jgi:ABC-2 type transport system ATP-binding protein
VVCTGTATGTGREALTAPEPTRGVPGVTAAGRAGPGNVLARDRRGAIGSPGEPDPPALPEEDAISSGSTAAPDPVRVDVSGLTKTFGSVRAVDDLSFTVEPGQVTGFLGPNGAGKTTTLRMALGLITPDRGTTTFNGTPYPALPQPIRQVGAVLETAFHPARSGRNHLRVYCRAAGLPLRRADEVLDQVGLGPAAGRKAGGYSLGMRQRLGLATALLGDPAVLVLDEPANGLDPEGIQWLRGFLRHLAHDQGRTVLVSSHLLTEVEQTADRVVIVGAGRLVRQGSLAELRAGGTGSVLVRSPQSAGLAELLRASGATATATDGTPDGLTVTGLPVEEVGRRAFAGGIELHELRARTSGLEEVYFRLTAGQEQYAAGDPVAATETRGAA